MPAILPTWAATGNIVTPDPSKISVGWLLGEKPPHEYMNWWQNLATQRINHVLTRGIPEWDSSISYQAGAVTKGAGGLVYRAIANNTNQNPASSPASWVQVTENASSLSSGTVPNARISGEYTNFTNITASGTITAAQLVGGGAGITGLNASNLGSGTVPNARISGAYTGFTTITATGTITGNLFAGSGASLTSLNASQLATGTVADTRLPGTMSGKIFSGAIQVPSGLGTTQGIGFGGTDNRIGSNGDDLRLIVNNSSRLVLSETNVTVTGGAVFTGNGSLLTALNASQLTSGTLPNARLAGAYSFGSLTLDTNLSAGGSIVVASNIGTDSSSGGIIYVNNTDGYFRAPSTGGAALFTFNGDTDSGLGRAGANAPAVYAGDVEVLRMTQTAITAMNGSRFAGSGSGLTLLPAGQLTGTVPVEVLPLFNWNEIGARIMLMCPYNVNWANNATIAGSNLRHVEMLYNNSTDREKVWLASPTVMTAVSGSWRNCGISHPSPRIDTNDWGIRIAQRML